MAEQARVTSIEAIEAFRNRLVLFRDRAGRVLDEVSEQLARTRNWLEHDQPARYQQELRRLQRELERREQELLSARLSPFRDSTLPEEALVRRLRREVEDLEARLRRVRQWQQRFDSHLHPMARRLETLRDHLGQDVARALGYLTEVLRSLTAYAAIQPGRDTSLEPRPDPIPGTADSTVPPEPS